MRGSIAFSSAVLGLVSAARAQSYGFVRQMVPPDTGDTEAVALGDLDGDGDLDAFIGNSNGAGGGVPVRPNRVYFNDGTGVFTDLSTLPPQPGATEAAALGDVDGDGDLDAFAGNFSQQTRLYLNDGTGTFTDVTSTNVPTSAPATTSLALGDVDADGDLDVFLGNYTQQDRLYLNVGAGVFADVTTTNLPTLNGATNSVALGDVDADGDLDVFFGSWQGQSRLYLNVGLGTYGNATFGSVPTVVAATLQARLGDVDGDGDLDAFLGNFNQQDLLYLNVGGGVFADVTTTNLPAQVDATRAVSLGDLDGDGDLDAITGNSGLNAAAEPNHLYLNVGAGFFADATAAGLPPLPDLTRSCETADVDADGDLDLFLGNRGQDRLYLNAGTGVLTDVTSANLPARLDATRAIALGDLDQDGDRDALTGNDAEERLYLNDGDGTFSATSFPVSIDNTGGLALGDVDGDGDLDAFVANSTVSSRLYSNDGTAGFTDVTATNLPFLFATTQAVALGDVDGDGDLDAILGNNLQPNRLYTNSGAGVFTDATAGNLPALLDDTRWIALGDLDGDGDLDAFLGNAGQDRLYGNFGTGAFADVTAASLPPVSDNTRGVALGDVDGDGDLDAFTGNSLQADRLYLNGGTGVFADATLTNVPVLLANTQAVALGDVDDDGDLDAFLGSFDEPDRLYVNFGTGLYTDVTSTALPPSLVGTRALALGDLDGDGDVDAFAGVEGEDVIYTNLLRQVAWRGIPRMGKPLTLDVRGGWNGVWLLVASVGSASIPLPPFGTLRLFPPTLFVVAGGPLDPQGRATLTALVPPNPTLVGASLYWQAVVGPPLRFTNIEITTVTGL